MSEVESCELETLQQHEYTNASTRLYRTKTGLDLGEWQIDVSLGPNATKRDELRAIISTALSFVPEWKRDTVKCVALYGSGVNGGKLLEHKVGDIDIVVFYDDDISYVYKRTNENEYVRGMGNELESADDTDPGSLNVGVSLNGDTITTNHEVDIQFLPFGRFLNRRNLIYHPDKHAEFVRWQQEDAQRLLGEKAVPYANGDKTFEDSIAEGILIWGANPLDEKGKPIFSREDSDLLKL